ncbi:alpha-protein kinase 2-like [Eudromia elegans]
MEDNRDIKNIFKMQRNIYCLGDVSENGGNLIHFNTTVSVCAGKSEKSCSKQVHFSPPKPIAYDTDNFCLNTEVSHLCAKDARTCEKSELGKPLTMSPPFDEQADIPVVNHCYFVKEDSENSGTLLEIHPKKSLSNDFSDDAFEYFECSDVLTKHENEIWEKKLQFLLERDDEDDLILSKDCDGCAYFLGEMPCLLQVSDNTAPMDTTIGFCGHHSKFKGVNLRRDPSASQATLQSDMTLTVGAHQDKAAGLRDREKYKLPVASAALENYYPRIEGENIGSGHSAADISTDKSQDRGNVLATVDSPPSRMGAALAKQATEVSEKNVDEDLPGDHALQLEEERRNLSEEKSRHAVCTLAENLRRNLLKLLNPKELCRYVSNMGQPLQTAAEHGESSAPFLSQEDVAAAQIHGETESFQRQPGLCQREEADKDCHWEWKRTWGLYEQNQVPDETLSPRFTRKSAREVSAAAVSAAAVSAAAVSAAAVANTILHRFPIHTKAARLHPVLLYAVGFSLSYDTRKKHSLANSDLDHSIDPSQLCMSQDASPNNFIQNFERRCVESGTEKKAVFMPGESAVTTKTASEMPSLEKALVKNAALQIHSQHRDQCHRSESHQQQFHWEQGINITSNDSKSMKDISACFLWDTGSVPDRQEYLCAVQSPAKLCHEPGERGQRCSFDSHDSNDTDALCVVSCDDYQFEAGGKTVQESGEPRRKGNADLSAVHNELWKLLVEADSDCQVPFENQGITSLEIRPKDVKVTGLRLVQKARPGHPVSTNLIEEEEPIIQPTSRQRTQKEDCNVSSILLKTDEACSKTYIENISFAQGIETVGKHRGSRTGNKKETPPIHISVNSILHVEKCLKQKTDQTLTGNGGSVEMTAVQEGKPARDDNAVQTCDGDSPQRLKNAQSSNFKHDKEKPAYMIDKSFGQLLYTDQNISLLNETITKCTDADTGEHSSVRDCYSPKNELAHFPEQKDFFPRNCCDENNSLFAHDEHSSVEAIPKSTEESLQGKGNHSDLNTQNDMNSDCYHLSKNDCKDFQVVSNTEKCSCLMQLPDLSETPETRTCKNLPQNIHQITEIENHKKAFIPSNKDRFLTDFLVEVPKYEQSEQKADVSCGPGVKHASESQPAVSLHSTSEQHVFFVDQTFKPLEVFKNSSENHTCASGSTAPLSTPQPERAQTEHPSMANEEYEDTGDQVDIQALILRGASPFLVSMGQSEGCSTSTSAMGCSSTRSQIQTESTKTVVKVDINLNKLDFSPEALQGQFYNVSQKNKDETLLQGKEEEIQRAKECNPNEAAIKPSLRALISSEAQEQLVSNTLKQSCLDLISSSNLTGAENSIKSTKSPPCTDKTEEKMASGSAVSGLVNLPPIASGNDQYCEEHPSHSGADPCSSAASAADAFPGIAERLRNQGGSKPHPTPLTAAEREPSRCRQDPAKGGHPAPSAQEKLPPAAQSKKPRLEERGSASKSFSGVQKAVKSEAGLPSKEDRKEQRKLPSKKDSKAPKLVKKIQAELFPDCSGNIKLCCQFGNIYGDSTITWTKDSKLLARLQRSAQDDSPISLAIAKASSKDQGMYYCCLKNIYGKVTAEFHLTSEVLEHLSSFQNFEGLEEIEFMQLMFREDSISDSYFGGNLHGAIATEELHFGEGMHRKAFRSRVLRGLVPLFSPGHPCVLKVHSAIMYGTRSKDDLVQKNYKLALQECYVQNMAREYAKIYAAEAEPLEGFGEVPEIIPIFLVHRPANNIPYATVEEELVGEFVKYSIKDGKEINFLRRDSEAGQKCCTFQHWVYERTNGSLLVTDLQGVGMKLTDVGIATLTKGYKGFKGNCSVSFIEQFKVLHQCNKYCEMLGLKSLQSTHQKQRKPSSTKSKTLPNSATVKKTMPSTQESKRTETSLLQRVE